MNCAWDDTALRHYAAAYGTGLANGYIPPGVHSTWGSGQGSWLETFRLGFMMGGYIPWRSMVGARHPMMASMPWGSLRCRRHAFPIGISYVSCSMWPGISQAFSGFPSCSLMVPGYHGSMMRGVLRPAGPGMH